MKLLAAAALVAVAVAAPLAFADEALVERDNVDIAPSATVKIRPGPSSEPRTSKTGDSFAPLLTFLRSLATSGSSVGSSDRPLDRNRSLAR